MSLYDRQHAIGDCFIGNAQLSLAAVPPNGVIFDLELRKLDRIVGMLRLELHWQLAAGPAGPVLETSAQVPGKDVDSPDLLHKSLNLQKAQIGERRSFAPPAEEARQLVLLNRKQEELNRG